MSFQMSLNHSGAKYYISFDNNNYYQ